MTFARRVVITACAAVLVLAPASTAFGRQVTRTWDGGGADSNFTTSANWAGDVAPLIDVDFLVFPDGVAKTSVVNDYPAGTKFASIYLTGLNGGYTLSGSSFRTGSIYSNGGVNTIASPLVAGIMRIDIATGGELRLTGVISGSWNLDQRGRGTLTITADSPVTGGIAASGGLLAVLGNLPSLSVSAISPPVFPSTFGGTVGGTGRIGSLFGVDAAFIAPGLSPGILTCASLFLFAQSTGATRIELNGTVAGSGYDRLTVAGAVELGGLLEVTAGFTPSVGTQFTIIDNQGGAPVSGTFLGLPQGATVMASGRPFTISYTGGTGNDVVLTAAAAVPALNSVVQAIATVFLLAGGAFVLRRRMRMI